MSNHARLFNLSNRRRELVAAGATLKDSRTSAIDYADFVISQCDNPNLETFRLNFARHTQMQREKGLGRSCQR